MSTSARPLRRRLSWAPARAVPDESTLTTRRAPAASAATLGQPLRAEIELTAVTPEEAADAVYLFCSPESNYISGQVIVAGGGLLI